MSPHLLLMKIILLAIISLPTGASSALAESGKQKLVGTWILDIEKSAESTGDDEAAEQMRQTIKFGLKVVMEYKADGTTRTERKTRGKTKRDTGKWKVIRENTKIITIQTINDSDVTPHESEIRFVANDLFRMSKRRDKVVLVWRRPKHLKETESLLTPPRTVTTEEKTATKKWLDKVGGEYEKTNGGVYIDLVHAEVTDAELAHLKKIKSLEELRLCSEITDEGLLHLRGLTSLRVLDLQKTKITDAGLSHLKKIKSLEELKLCFKNITDESLMHLADVAWLRVLDLKGTKITDAGLVHLKKLKSLRGLNLRLTNVSDEGVEHLNEIKSLRSLDLQETKITDTGLVHLKALTSLEELNLYEFSSKDARITDAGLENLKGLTSLEKMNLFGTGITDAGLEHLKSLKSLRELDVSQTKITDAGLEHLKEVKSLTVLIFRFNDVTDVGLMHLKELKSLKRLAIVGTKITVNGEAQFKKALPDCRLHR